MKISSKRTLTAIIAAFALSLGLFSYFSIDALALSKQVYASPSVSRTGSDLPVRLKIPKINLDTAIEYVGLTKEGGMDVPKNRSNVGWFNLGTRPGDEGSAVVAGHFGWKNGKASAFDNLSKLKKGDRIYVQDKKGAVVSFVVREIRSLDRKADASSVFNSRDGKAHLNLITCEGVWNKTEKSYSKRLVVFADRE